MPEKFPEEFLSLSLLNGWKPGRLIGQGGMGCVYELTSEGGAKAALKWIHLEKRGGQQNLDFISAQTRLINELGLQLELGSKVSQIVAIREHKVIQSPDGDALDAFIRMDLLTPLKTWLAQRTHTVSELLDVLKDVSVAVDACHAEGILHRDIKPENILMDSSGFKLGDFGVAGIASLGDAQNSFTRAYAPPEFNGSDWDEKGDLYALGLTMYCLFNNGFMPYQNSADRDDESRAWATRQEAWQNGSALYPPPGFAPNEEAALVLCRAAAIKREERYSSAGEFCRALEAALGDDEETLNRMVPYRESISPRRTDEVTGSIFSRSTDTDASTARATSQVLFQDTPGEEPPRSEEEPDTPDTPPETEKHKGSSVISFTDFPIYDPEKENGKTQGDGAPQFVVETDDTPAKKKCRLPLVIALLAIAALLGFGAYKLFAPKSGGDASAPAPTPVPVADFSVEFDGITAVLKGPAGAYAYFPDGSESLSKTVENEGEEVLITGLLPATQYVITAPNGARVTGKTSQRTAEALNVKKAGLTLYRCLESRAYVDGKPKNLANKDYSPSVSALDIRDLEDEDIKFAVRLDVTMQRNMPFPEGDTLTMLIRKSEGEVRAFSLPMVFSADAIQHFAYDITSPLQQMKRDGALPQEGSLKLQAFWGDVKLCELTVSLATETELE